MLVAHNTSACVIGRRVGQNKCAVWQRLACLCCGFCCSIALSRCMRSYIFVYLNFYPSACPLMHPAYTDTSASSTFCDQTAGIRNHFSKCFGGLFRVFHVCLCCVLYFVVGVRWSSSSLPVAWLAFYRQMQMPAQRIRDPDQSVITWNHWMVSVDFLRIWLSQFWC